jgi:hypothetical protein
MVGDQVTPLDPSGEAPEEIDMAESEHVAWVKAQRDPALWHQAAMAALSYRGDADEFLAWLVEQPEMDRATAGWIFLWAEGSRFLRGETHFPLDTISSESMGELFRALCTRSETLGFSRDSLGLDPEFEAERNACLEIVAQGKAAADIVVPHAIIARPFPPPRKDARFLLDDGLILRL